MLIIKKTMEYRNEKVDDMLKEEMNKIPEEHRNTPKYKELKRLYDAMKIELYEIKDED